jgi:competence protein ComEA
VDPTPPTPPPVPPPAKSRAQAALVALAVVAAGAVGVRAYAPRFTAAPTERTVVYKVDLNAAGERELALIPHVGPATAAAIVRHRDEHGPFASVDGLTAVKGIGPKTLEKVGPYLAVSATPPDRTEPVELKRKPAESPPAASTSREKLRPGDPPIDVNTATVDELQRIPKIGPGMAAKIVATRANKPFASVDDLRRVSGIGPKTFDTIRPFVTVKSPESEK